MQTLSDCVRQILAAVDRHRSPLPDDPRRAAAAAAELWHPGMIVTAPSAVNVGALALAHRPRVVAHELRAGAVRLALETDLHSLPGEAPPLLRGAWLLEVRQPEREALIGALPGDQGPTVSLGGYVLDGAIYLVGLQRPDGARVARWTPRWGERELDAGLPALEGSPLIDDVSAHHEWAREAARLALVLGLLLDASGAPLRVEEERSGRSKRGAPTSSSGGEWVTRRVYLDERRSPGSASAAGAGAPSGDRDLAVVPVRGHLRRQPYGPGGSLRRWTWIEAHEGRRWVAPKPLRIVVS